MSVRLLEGVAYFTARVIDEGRTFWSPCYRYSRWRQLHDDVAYRDVRIGGALSTLFPPKEFLRSSRTGGVNPLLPAALTASLSSALAPRLDPNFLDKRCWGLSVYLDALLCALNMNTSLARAIAPQLLVVPPPPLLPPLCRELRVTKPSKITRFGLTLRGSTMVQIEPSGLLAGTGVEPGDRLILVNGENVISAQQGAALLRAAEGEVLLVVQPQTAAQPVEPQEEGASSVPRRHAPRPSAPLGGASRGRASSFLRNLLSDQHPPRLQAPPTQPELQ